MIDCIIGRSAVLLEDQLLCWKIDYIIGRSTVLLEDQLRRSAVLLEAVLKTINRNRWKLLIKENNCKKMTA